MLDVPQELMTPGEAARWFRRSASWLRQQRDLLHSGTLAGQPLYHVRVCRAFILGRLCGLSGDALRRVQVRALATACGVPEAESLGGLLRALEPKSCGASSTSASDACGRLSGV